MMTSDQIAQQHTHQFRAGYGGGVNSYESGLGLTPMGHGAGSQAGMSMLSGVSALAGASQMVGLGALGGGFLLNKLGLGGSAIAKGLGRVAVGTGMTLPAALSLGVVTPALAGLQAAASGGQQYTRTQSVMDNAFGSRVNMGGAFGYGVSRQDALSLTESMRQLAGVPEMMTSMKELESVLSKVSQMGIMQGVRDAKEFKRKFKDMTSALREMSRNLGTTLEETLPFLQSSVRQGFLDPQQIKRNVQMTSSASGVGIGVKREELFGLQERGAQMLRQMGADSRVGAEGARDFASTLSVAQSMGVLSDQEITRITGQTGGKGVTSLAQTLLGAQSRLFQQSGAGRFITAALAERGEDGLFTGRLDSTLLERLRRGQVTGEELMRAGEAQLNSLTQDQALSFENAMGRGMGAEAGALAGVGGGATAIRAILADRGVKSREAQRRLIQSMTGISQASADAMLTIAEDAARVIARQENEIVQAAARDRSAAYYKENFTLSGAMHHAGTFLRRTLVDPFSSAGAGAVARFGERFDDIAVDFMGSGALGKLGMALNPLTYGRMFFGTASRRGLTQEASQTMTARLLRQGIGETQVSLKDAALAAGRVFNGDGGVFGGLAYTDIFGKSFGEKYNRTYTAEERARGRDRLAQALLKRGLSTQDLESLDTLDVEDLLGDVGGLEGLIAAGRGESGMQGASVAANNLRAALEAPGLEDVGEVFEDIDETFSGGFFDRLVLGASGKQAYSSETFVASAEMKDMMLGGQQSRAELLKILKDKDLLRELRLNAGNPEMLEQIARSYGLSLDKNTLSAIGTQINSLYNQRFYIPTKGDDLLSELTTRLGGYAEVLDRQERGTASKLLGRTITQRFGTEDATLGKGFLQALRTEGSVLQRAQAIGSLFKEGDPQSAFGKRMKDLFASDSVGDQSEEDVLQQLKRMGISGEEAGFTVDGKLDATEKKNANLLLALNEGVSPLLTEAGSRSMRLAESMGASGKMRAEAEKAQQETLRAHSEFVREVGIVVPQLQDAARRAEMANQQRGTTTR